MLQCGALMTPIESLHTHTTLSDGQLSHRVMFDLAESLGIAVLAFTDHDAVPPPMVMAELETLREHSTKWITGIEITAGLPKELAPETGAMHIIGLFLDPTNTALVEHCHLAQNARVKRMEGIVGNLQKLGFKISSDDCLEMSGGESVGRPHIVQAIKKYPENNIVMERIRLEMAAEASQNTEVQKQYTRMMQRGENEYPYTLFLAPEAFRRGYVEHEYMPDLDEAVKLIRDAGGVAILAHYYTIRPKMPPDALEQVLSMHRLDGLEVVYGLRAYGTAEEVELENERALLRDLAKKYNTIVAGGSDAHTKKDLERYVMSSRLSNESVGLASRILAKVQVSKKSSSF